MEYANNNFPEQVSNQKFDHYLFPSRKGSDQPLSLQALWFVLSDAVSNIGLKSIGSHSMWKAFGYFLYKNGTHIEIIQELLNHSSQRETLKHIGITQEDKDTAVMSLDL